MILWRERVRRSGVLHRLDTRLCAHDDFLQSISK
jgi:hypothetical protein